LERLKCNSEFLSSSFEFLEIIQHAVCGKSYNENCSGATCYHGYCTVVLPTQDDQISVTSADSRQVPALYATQKTKVGH